MLAGVQTIRSSPKNSVLSSASRKFFEKNWKFFEERSAILAQECRKAKKTKRCVVTVMDCRTVREYTNWVRIELCFGLQLVAWEHASPREKA